MARGLRDEVGVVWGTPDPKQTPKHNGAPRTKKVRWAYHWYKSMHAESAWPLGARAGYCSAGGE